MRSLWFSSVVCLALWPARAATPASSERLLLDASLLGQLVSEATEAHPQLRAARLRQTAAHRAVRGVRVWEDPRVRFGGVVARSPGPDLEMEGDLLYEVEQALPLFGKAHARRQAAEAAAGVADADSEYRLQLLRRDIVQAAHSLALADAVLAIGRQDLELVERMAGFLRERQAAGLEGNVEFLRLETERERRLQDLETDRLRRDFERATLNRFLARPQDSPWPILETPDIAPEIPFSAGLILLALQNEPRLSVLRRDTLRAEAAIEVSRRARHPEVALSVGGRQWSGSGAFREGMIAVGVNLPWFNRSRYRADLDRDRALAEASHAEARDYELEVRREVFRVWTLIDASRREALLYRDRLLPRWELVVDNSLAAWSVGRGRFLELLDARRELTEARLSLARAIADQHRMIAELVTCCGIADLDALEMLEHAPAPPAEPAVP